ncbi:Unknown protein [Striga hermonthica]|uniref:Transposase n=1 Tax=Striga hermonthica TaxID=68872 RepID=A0A9N7R981_STRHE|nr:Unknown protein [Striga hermonthica]
MCKRDSGRQEFHSLTVIVQFQHESGYITVTQTGLTRAVFADVAPNMATAATLALGRTRQEAHGLKLATGQAIPVSHSLIFSSLRPRAPTSLVFSSISGDTGGEAMIGRTARMDDQICIRFHYGGSFTTIGGSQFYVGGDIAESWIDMDRLSYFEVVGHLSDHYNSSSVGHLSDHYNSSSVLTLYWLIPRKHESNGLVLLVDDESCKIMASQHIGYQCVDMYVEEVTMELNADDQDRWLGDDGGYGANVNDFLQDIATNGVDKSLSKDSDKGKGPVITEDEAEGVHDEGSDESSDEDYKQPSDEDSSANDEEAIELRNYARQIKRNIRATKLGIHASAIGEIRAEDLVDEVPNLDEPGSPYLDSSEDYSYEENSDGETQRWKSLENRFDSKAELPVFTLGMAFIDSRQFKNALVKYGLKAHKSLHFVKDEKSKVRAICDWPGCNWMIYGSKTTRSKWFKVVTFSDQHTCPPRRDNNLVTSSLIANKYYNQIKDNPTWPAALIKAAVLKDFLADVSLSKCKRAKSIVQKQTLDAISGEYSRVYDYQLELLRSNPGSTVVVYLDPKIEDKKIFERDANNQMYPVAWAATGSCLCCKRTISNGGQDWVLISDQQKGLLKAVKELVPNAKHRMCARHIYANWRKKYTDKKLWWRCAKASNRTLFNMYRAYLAQDTPEGAQDMMTTSPEHWSRAFFRLGNNCDSVDNNMCESFNHSIMEARFYPVISMCEAIRKKMNIELSGKCIVLWNGADGFEVQDWEDRKYIVKLMTREWTCNYWQLSGLPCCYAISAIYKSSHKPEDYIALCFSKSAYMRTYEHVLMPVQGPDNWPISDMPRPLPPPYVKMPGRPKTQRRREPWEQPKGTKLSKVGIKMRCRLCGKNDHNARRCPKNSQASNKKMAHITREKNRKRKEAEKASVGTSVEEKSTTKETTASTPSASQPIPTQASQAPRQATARQAASRSGLPTSSQSARSTTSQAASGSGLPTSSQAARATSSQAASGSRLPTSSQAATARASGSGSGSRLAHLLFGDNY